jgi:diguanylate cyclase (GGDEF)-like protein
MRMGIQKKLALSLSSFLLIVFGFSCWGIISFSTRLQRENIQKQQFAMTELIARSIDDKLGTYLATIAQVASAVPADAFENPAKAQAFLDSHLDLRSVFDNGIVLFDTKPSLVAESPFIEGRRGTRVQRLKQFLRSVGENDFPDVSNPYISPKTNAPAIVMAAPITDRSKRLRGFLVGSINLTRDYFIESLMSYKIGKKGYLYLFNTERTMILHPDKNRIMRNDIPPGSNKLLDRAIEGFEGSGETINSKGVPQIASFKRLKVVDWILATAYPQEEAYAPIKRMRNYLIAAASLVTLLSIVLIWLLTSRITASLDSFTGQVRLIRENPERSHEIDIVSSDEVSLLADTFNGLMRELDLARDSLDKMTRTDHLTGLFNRRHLEIEAPKLMAISERQNASTAVLMVDIDHFKRINDAYGHETGDAVLMHLAEMLPEAVRPYDLVVRHGGDEFLLLMPLTTSDGAMEVAERLRSNIQDTPVSHGKEKLSITVSIGVYVFEQMHDVQEAIARADAALYDAKYSGRNRVCLAPA